MPPKPKALTPARRGWASVPIQGRGEPVDLVLSDMAPNISGSAPVDQPRAMYLVELALDLARAYVDMGDPQGARSILEEVLDEGDESQRQQAQQLLDTLPG